MEFSLAGELFCSADFPKLYRMYEASLENTEAQLRSIAEAWHGGNIVSAAVALESDLAHG